MDLQKCCNNCHWYDVETSYCLEKGKPTQEDATCKACLLVDNQMGAYAY